MAQYKYIVNIVNKHDYGRFEPFYYQVNSQLSRMKSVFKYQDLQVDPRTERVKIFLMAVDP